MNIEEQIDENADVLSNAPHHDARSQTTQFASGYGQTYSENGSLPHFESFLEYNLPDHHALSSALITPDISNIATASLHTYSNDLQVSKDFQPPPTDTSLYEMVYDSVGTSPQLAIGNFGNHTMANGDSKDSYSTQEMVERYQSRIPINSVGRAKGSSKRRGDNEVVDGRRAALRLRKRECSRRRRVRHVSRVQSCETEISCLESLLEHIRGDAWHDALHLSVGWKDYNGLPSQDPHVLATPSTQQMQIAATTTSRITKVCEEILKDFVEISALPRRLAALPIKQEYQPANNSPIDLVNSSHTKISDPLTDSAVRMLMLSQEQADHIASFDQHSTQEALEGKVLLKILRSLHLHFIEGNTNLMMARSRIKDGVISASTILVHFNHYFYDNGYTKLKSTLKVKQDFSVSERVLEWTRESKEKLRDSLPP